MAALKPAPSKPGGVAFKFKAKVWLYEGPTAWHFVTLPKDLSANIKRNFDALKRGWGSLRVAVTVGKTTWKTSIFPDSKRGAYLLPIKADVRAKEKITLGENRSFVIDIEI